MLKLTGIFLILIVDFFIVKFILDNKRNEITFIRACITFLKNISIEIIELKKPLYEAIIINKCAISSEIDEIIDNFTLQNASPREAIIKVFKAASLLDEATKRVIIEYLNIAGRTTKEGMADFLSVTIRNLEYILAEKIEKNKNSKKTTNAIVYSLSILLIILII